jgi:hypothetical protein
MLNIYSVYIFAPFIMPLASFGSWGHVCARLRFNPPSPIPPSPFPHPPFQNPYASNVIRREAELAWRD